MSTNRRFLVAPALVRLIRKERGGTRITEGHFAPQGGRNSYVRVDGQICHLILVNGGVEERTEVPRAHGDALLDVCPGKVAYDRTVLTVGGREVQIDRYVTPGNLDLVNVAFDGEGEAAAFQAPAWFGREVGNEAAYDRQALAIQGVPAAEETGLSNAALDAVLDLIEPRFGFGRYGSSRNGDAGEATAPPVRRAPPAPPAPEPVAVSEPAPPAAKPEPEEPAHAEPVHHEPAIEPEPATAVHQDSAAPDAAPGQPQAAPHGDARIDDVIESLSQALGAAIHQHPDTAEKRDEKDEAAPMFERWTVRPRRNQQQS